jgi:hypothetical protein
MHSLSEIKQKLAEEKGYPDWESYASIAPISSTDELARKCWEESAITTGDLFIEHILPIFKPTKENYDKDSGVIVDLSLEIED